MLTSRWQLIKAAARLSMTEVADEAGRFIGSLAAVKDELSVVEHADESLMINRLPRRRQGRALLPLARISLRVCGRRRRRRRRPAGRGARAVCEQRRAARRGVLRRAQGLSSTSIRAVIHY